MHENLCPKDVLGFYENINGFVKAVVAVKSHYLCSNVRIHELFVGISCRKWLCPAKLPDLCKILLPDRGGKKKKGIICHKLK